MSWRHGGQFSYRLFDAPEQIDEQARRTLHHGVAQARKFRELGVEILFSASDIADNHRYDDKFQIIHGYAIRPDFYLPRHDVYIEYWGMDTTDYKIGMLHKQKLYQQEGKKLISLYPADLPVLDAKLAAELLGLTGRTEPGIV